MVEFITIIAVLLGVLGLAYLISRLKSRGIYNEDIIPNLQDAITLAKYILEVAPFDPAVRDKSLLIFDIANSVADYVYDLDDVENKQELALSTSIEILNKLNIDPSNEQIRLMEQAIFESFKWIENNKKIESFS